MTRVALDSNNAGAAVLLTEDMQDDRLLVGMRLINPFVPANDEAIEAVLGD